MGEYVKRVTRILLKILLTVLLISNISLVYAQNTISGTMHLPTSAGVGGATVIVSVSDLNSSASQTIFVALSEGVSSGAYSATFPFDANASWRLFFNCFSGCDELSLLTLGYYDSTAPNNTSPNQTDATPLVGGVDHSGIDMTALLGTTVNGIINLPSVAGVGGIGVSIKATEDGGSRNQSAFVTIAEGTASVGYNFGIPPEPGFNWRLEYFCFACAAPLLQTGYYAIGVPNTTVEDPALTTLLASGMDHTAKNMTVLSGDTLSGTLHLVSPAPAGGRYVTVEISNSNNEEAFVSVEFLEGVSVADYSLGLPTSAAVNWQLRYDCFSCPTPAMREGFYSDSAPNNTTSNPSNATLFVGGASYSGKDMTILLDSDDDDLSDLEDNCPKLSNPDQADLNANGIGDVCDNEGLCFPVKTLNGKITQVCALL